LPDAAAEIAPGESVELTCTHHKSTANQPTVNGQQVAPRDVAWGESTLDEMCLVYLGTVTPFEPEAPAGAACAPFADCLAACEVPGSTACVMGCADRGTACVSCFVKSAKDCSPSCLVPVVSNRPCLVNCGISATSLGGAYGSCLEGTCPDTLSAFDSCMDPAVAAGTCDAQLDACGVPR
jgi:hypothetical protein